MHLFYSFFEFDSIEILFFLFVLYLTALCFIVLLYLIALLFKNKASVERSRRPNWRIPSTTILFPSQKGGTTLILQVDTWTPADMRNLLPNTAPGGLYLLLFSIFASNR